MEQIPANSVSKGDVLVVDDTAVSLSFLCDLLGENGYSVRAAPNGELALWTATSHVPDLILLDVRMPGMDGYQVCRALKEDERTRDVPVIFLSAQSDVEDKVRGLQAGGVDYVGKPFAMEEVLQRVATHVKLARVTRELAHEKEQLEVRVRERTIELVHAATALQQEVAAHKAAADELRQAASAFKASLSGMFITDARGIIVAINPAFTTTTGYTAAECIGSNTSILNSGRHEKSFFRELWTSIQRDGSWSGEIWNRRKDGNVCPYFHTIAAIRDEGGSIVNYVGVLVDLSESKDAQTLIEFLTHHDALTGLPMRSIVRERFEQIVATRHAEETIAVICVNLDRFRFINDFHGYTLGNEVLQWVAGQLTDCVGEKDLIFRESGDEYVIVHHDRSAVMHMRVLIDAILTRLNSELEIDDIKIALSASLGVGIYPIDGSTLEDLVGNASIAMARAKEKGGESYAFFTGDIDQGVRVRFDLAQRLRYALERNELEVYYQPQIDAVTGGIVSAEALLRWRTPEHGFISPALFIPVAEETGRIVEIGNWVLRSVCRQIAAWRQQGYGQLKVAVNLSALQFMRQDLCATVSDILTECGVPASSLELEITEGAIIEDVQRAIATMQGLKAIGATISLDDFGTGYSSLSYLKRFPLDYLKIDQSFVRDLIADADADAIVLSIIGLARNMRMKVIAEGVETMEQHEFLAQNGCDLMQGYLHGKPVCATDFLERLREG